MYLFGIEASVVLISSVTVSSHGIRRCNAIGQPHLTVLWLMLLSWFCASLGSPSPECDGLISNYLATPIAKRAIYKNALIKCRQKLAMRQRPQSRDILKRYPLMNVDIEQLSPGSDTTAVPDHFQSGLWAVKIRYGQDDASREELDVSAEMIARRHGLENHGQIGELKGYYLFTKRGAADTWTTMASAVAHTTGRAAQGIESSTARAEQVDPTDKRQLFANAQVEWQGRQELLCRSKRAAVPTTESSRGRQASSYAADSSTANPYEPITKFNTTPARSNQPLSTPSMAPDEEKSRHEFFINIAKGAFKSSTVTSFIQGATQNAKYVDMFGVDSAGGVGSRRMGLDLDEEDVSGVDAKLTHNGPKRFQDPLYYRQWHLENIISGTKGVGDCNVTGVWARGVTGKGVVVAVVDDGVQWNHPDLIENYCAEGSFDLNSNDDDPTPVRDDKEENKHGTRCAGEIAAAANEHCGIGVAHGAKFSGIRILDGPLTDSMEAAAFNKHFDVNDIYSNRPCLITRYINSCSWGPEDDGKTVDGPHPLAQAALQHGIMKGRQGYGSVYIVASGNGGHNGDNCNYDGYANSIYTITIGAVDEFGRVPSYAEECASMLACTFSSGAGAEDGKARKIVTTDWTLGTNKRRVGGCTESHTGTSAATPLAAGMVALMLEARPCLSWRDIQYIMVMTSVKIHSDEDEWTNNAAGFHHSDKRGFGLLNAWRLVNAARVWRRVPWLVSLEAKSQDKRRVIPSAKSRALIVTTIVTEEECDESTLRTLEKVSVIVNIDHPRRGDLFITLVCPSGTTSVIGKPRQNDDSTTGLWNWAFTTVKCWGEEPHGVYRLIIHDTSGHQRTLPGELRSWKLILYGSSLTTKDIEGQRESVTFAMSGQYLQSWYEPQYNRSYNSGENQIGYCPPVNKPVFESNSLLRMSTSERALKLTCITGCLFLLWILYYVCDSKAERGKKNSGQTEETQTLQQKVTVNSFVKIPPLVPQHCEKGCLEKQQRIL